MANDKVYCMQWQEVLDNLIFTATKGNTWEQIKNLSAEDDLIRFFMDDDYKDIILKWIGNVYTASSWRKCRRRAKRLREEGNMKFRAKDYQNCLSIYTESIKYAPAQSEELSLSLGNRSAVLFNMGYYEGAIIDIDLAFAHGFPQHLRYKLHQRKSECLVQLGKYRDAVSELRLAQELLQSMKHTPMENISLLLKSIDTAVSGAETQLSTGNQRREGEQVNTPKLPVPLQGVSEEFAHASKALCVRENKEKGRHVAALCDISVGDVLFVEKPFASVLLPEHYLDRCHHCCNLLRVPMPCWECTTVLYCSESCRNNSWSEYHKWECNGGLDIIHCVGIAHLGLRIVLKAGAISEHKAWKKRLEKNEYGRNEQYLAVYHLVTHLENMTAYDRAAYALTAVCLVLYLDHYTDYIHTSGTNQNGDASNVDDTIMMGCILLHHICQLVCNGHAITAIQETKPEAGNDVVDEYQIRVATAIFPSASLMNHSCDPNIINSFLGTQLIVKAYKDIKKGQEVSNCYGPNFRRTSRKNRKESLKAQYYFECLCENCTSDEEFLERFQALLCVACDGPLLRETFKARKVKCPKCGSCYDSNELLAISARAHSAYKKGRALMDKGSLKEALIFLLGSHEFHLTCLYKSHLERRTCLDSIAKCYAILGNYVNSTVYLEKTLPAIEEQYGSWSIEMAHELQKLADSMICELNHVRYTKDDVMTKHANVLKYLLKAKEIFQLHYGIWNHALQDILRKEAELKSVMISLNTSST